MKLVTAIILVCLGACGKGETKEEAPTPSGEPAKPAADDAKKKATEDDEAKKKDKPCKRPELPKSVMALATKIADEENWPDGKHRLLVAADNTEAAKETLGKMRAAAEAAGWKLYPYPYSNDKERAFFAAKDKTSMVADVSYSQKVVEGKPVASHFVRIDYRQTAVSWDLGLLLPEDATDVRYGQGGGGFEFKSKLTYDEIAKAYIDKGWEKNGPLFYPDMETNTAQINMSGNEKTEWILYFRCACEK